MQKEHFTDTKGEPEKGKLLEYILSLGYDATEANTMLAKM